MREERRLTAIPFRLVIVRGHAKAVERGALICSWHWVRPAEEVGGRPHPDGPCGDRYYDSGDLCDFIRAGVRPPWEV